VLDDVRHVRAPEPWPRTLSAPIPTRNPPRAESITRIRYDFKSVEGDRRFGIGSLPVRLGPERAARVACAAMAVPQAVVAALLLHWGAAWQAGAVGLLLLAQIGLMARLLRDPRALAPWYNATGVTLYVVGMLVCAFALRPESAVAG
jgi:chlorophyll/bacteriochlorophyll a synthase